MEEGAAKSEHTRKLIKKRNDLQNNDKYIYIYFVHILKYKILYCLL